MMTTAAGPNSESPKRGIMPRMVVSDASMTGRKRLAELSIRASTGSLPAFI